MEHEAESDQESVPQGRLYFLSHPGSNLLSGYGITTRSGRADHLAGILMVDRPKPADPAWLEEIEARYGPYELTAMTRSGERGLVTQMRIAPDSLAYLSPSASPVGRAIETALQPLLDNVPTPILKLHWDPVARLWRSRFWTGLSPELQQVFARQGPGCLAVELGDRISFITHVASSDLAHFRGCRMLSRWELHVMPTAPLIRFHAAILDRAGQAYYLEHFLNVESTEQARYLAKLTRQEELFFDFFGTDYEYASTTAIAHPPELRRQLNGIVRRAVDYYGELAPHRRDFDRAKAEFLRRFPLGWSP